MKALSYREAAKLAKKKGWTIKRPKTGTKVVFVSPGGTEFPASSVRGNVPLPLAKALLA